MTLQWIDENEPIVARTGEFAFEFEGYQVWCPNTAFMLWKVDTMDGTPLPRELEGMFTKREEARKAITIYGERKAKQEADAIEKASRPKLSEVMDRAESVFKGGE